MAGHVTTFAGLRPDGTPVSGAVFLDDPEAWADKLRQEGWTINVDAGAPGPGTTADKVRGRIRK